MESRGAISQLLLKNKLIDPIKIAEYQNKAELKQQTLLHYLQENTLLPAQQLALLIAEHFSIPFFDLDALNYDYVPWQLLDDTLIPQFQIAPLFIRGNHLFLATDNPLQIPLKDIQFHTKFYPKPVIVENHKLKLFIEKIEQRKHRQPFYSLAKKQLENSGEFNEVPLIELVNSLILNAIKRNVSDIHFELYEDYYRVRYRLDGLLTTAATLHLDIANRITARIKIMANLDISERRIPQDGRFKMAVSPQNLRDCRVNICPTVNGEKVVIRLLNPQMPKTSIDALGLNTLQKKQFLSAIEKPQGMILITGPTGSGKTVSLYSALNLLNTGEKNISTVEDPVEIKLAGINQVSIMPQVGLTFATTLRSFLRQDPDIIMIGEMRDLETAEIAIQAAHTGHLIFSTLHTNSAAQTLTRLVDMGIPAFNIASALTLLMAQRLVRRLCDHCKKIRNDLSENDLKQLGFKHQALDDLVVYQARGCETCNKGYQGRIAIFEVMPISTAISHLILKGGSARDLLKQAQTEGMLTLYQSGLEKVQAGMTSLEELKRVIVN